MIEDIQSQLGAELVTQRGPLEIRKFRKKLARRAAERGDLAPEALEEWGYLVPEPSTTLPES